MVPHGAPRQTQGKTSNAQWFLFVLGSPCKLTFGLQIIYHGGPTNSGKTYNALQRLKSAKPGLYVGPLRLLAAEIYETLNAQGVYTSLITGQERREFPFSTHVAATVEMAANLLEEEFDVVVIDEIQMIENKERGFAWTRALLGLRCKEIHVCGGLEAKGLIEKIASACGDDFELNTYDRFGALNVAEKSLATHPDQTGSFKGVCLKNKRLSSCFPVMLLTSAECVLHTTVSRFELETVSSLSVVMTFLQSNARLNVIQATNAASSMVRYPRTLAQAWHSYSTTLVQATIS